MTRWSTISATYNVPLSPPKRRLYAVTYCDTTDTEWDVAMRATTSGSDIERELYEAVACEGVVKAAFTVTVDTTAGYLRVKEWGHDATVTETWETQYITDESAQSYTEDYTTTISRVHSDTGYAPLIGRGSEYHD